jgi:hypothetical protein
MPETHVSGHRPSLLRSRDHRAHVTNVELFFDLVFVFAVTQLSHTLLGHLSLAGALQTGFLLLAVWWVWMYTCWFTNWIDPDRPTVRMLMFLLMLAGLLMSAAIPHAFAAPATSLADAAALLGHAALVAGVDTGLTHLAVALGRPTVGIYCATRPELTGLHGVDGVNLGGPGKPPSVQAVAAALGCASEPPEPQLPEPATAPAP